MTMTRYEANKILDQIRDGSPCDSAITNKCLNVTGDLGVHEEQRSEGVAGEEEKKDWCFRVRERAILVGRSKE
jgi:hypothetical protein